MKGAARKRGPFQRHRRAVFSRRGQTGINPPASPVSSGTQTNNHRRDIGISKHAARQLPGNAEDASNVFCWRDLFRPLSNRSIYHSDKHQMHHSPPALPAAEQGSGFRVSSRLQVQTLSAEDAHQNHKSPDQQTCSRSGYLVHRVVDL